MPKFLNNIDLNGNQLLSPVIHVSTQSTHTNGPAGNTTGTEGQIFYNDDAKALFYRDDSAWRPIGDITGVAFTTDDSTTISDTAGSASFTITGGAGITTSSTGSTITIVTSNDQNTTGNAATVTTNANLTGHVTSSGNAAVLGSFSLAQLNTAISDGTVGTQTLPSDFVSAASGGTFGGNVTVGTNSLTAGGFVIGGHTVSDIDITSEFEDEDDHVMSSKAIGARFALKNADTTGTAGTVTNATLTTALTVNTGTLTLTANSANNSVVTIGAGAVGISGSNTGDQTLPTDFVSAANGGTFSGGVSFGDNNISNVGVIGLDSIEADNTSIKIGDQASKTVTLGRANTTTTNEAGESVATSPSVQTAVSVLGDLAVAGNLTISGDLTTVSTSNTAIKDTIIVLNAGHTGSQTKDIAVLFERGNETNVAFRWDESAAAFDLIATVAAGNEATGAILKADPNSNGENAAGTAGYQSLRVNGVVAPGGFTGPLTGNASTATKIATITNADIVQKTSAQTLTNKTIAISQVTELSNLTADEGAQLENIDTTTISATQWGYLGAASGAITNSDTIDMGDGFTVAATTTGTGTTITEGDSLTIAAGTGISTTGTSDGVVTIASTLTTNANHSGDVTGSGALTLAAAQTNVTSMYNAALKVGRGTDNQIDFATDDHIIFTTKDDSELTLSDTHLYPSAVQGLHLGTTTNGFRSLNLIAANADANSSLVRFEKQRTNATTALQNNDDLAKFSFFGNNAAAASHEYMRWLVEASDVTTDSEAVTYKQLFITDGTLRTGFKVTGQADDTLDVNIGYGAAGVTTLAGTLTVGSTAVIDNGGDWVGGAIGQSYIDTETINEARLQVSNAPTNDYVLVADSGVTGGLKWASASTTAGNVATATNLAANTDQAVPVGTIELGHATDTTIARSAAGKATIEGNLIGVVKTFTLNDTGVVQSNNDGAASTVFTITHGMGDSRFYKVEVVLSSGDYDTVFADIARPSVSTITVTFASNVALGAYAAMVTRMA